MQIFVISCIGFTITLDVESTNTIEIIKAKFCAETDIPPNYQIPLLLKNN